MVLRAVQHHEFSVLLTTEGLNVPADSKPSPWGDTMGSGESRVHFPKGGVKGAAAAVARATRTTTERVNVRAARVAKRETLTIGVQLVCRKSLRVCPNRLLIAKHNIRQGKTDTKHFRISLNVRVYSSAAGHEIRFGKPKDATLDGLGTAL
jgi:hypothetical protein